MDIAEPPWFAKSTLKPLEELGSEVQQLLGNYSQQVVKRYGQVNGQLYAISFDPSIQMLFYRQDIFNDAKIKRMLYEKYKRELVPPIGAETIRQYLDSLNVVKNLSSTWWNESVSLFENGDIVMLIVYINLFSHTLHSTISPLVGFDKVPDNKALIGGGSLGISKYSKKC